MLWHLVSLLLQQLVKGKHAVKNARKKVNAAVPYANTELGKKDPGGQINIMKQSQCKDWWQST